MDAQVKPPFGWYADPNHPRNEDLVVSLLFNEGAGLDCHNSAIDRSGDVVGVDPGAYVFQDAVNGEAVWTGEGLKFPGGSTSRVVIPKETLLLPQPIWSFVVHMKVHETWTTSDGRHLIVRNQAGNSNGDFVMYWSNDPNYNLANFGYAGSNDFYEGTDRSGGVQIDAGTDLIIVWTSKNTNNADKTDFRVFADGVMVSQPAYWWTDGVVELPMSKTANVDWTIFSDTITTAWEPNATLKSLRLYNREIPVSEMYEVAAQPYAGYRSPRIDTRTLAAILAAGGGGAAIDSGPLNIGIGIGL